MKLTDQYCRRWRRTYLFLLGWGSWSFIKLLAEKKKALVRLINRPRLMLFRYLGRFYGGWLIYTRCFRLFFLILQAAHVAFQRVFSFFLPPGLIVQILMIAGIGFLFGKVCFTGCGRLIGRFMIAMAAKNQAG